MGYRSRQRGVEGCFTRKATLTTNSGDRDHFSQSAAQGETGAGKGVVEQSRVIPMLQFMEDAAEFDELRVPANFGFHALAGDRAGVFAMTVSRQLVDDIHES